MPPVRGKMVAIRAERTENLLGPGSSNPPNRRTQIAKTPLAAAIRLCVFLQQIERARSLRLAQGSLNRLNARFAVNLVTRHLQQGLLRECPKGPAVTRGEGFRRVPAGGAPVAGLLTGQHDTRRHAFDVPRPRP